jgi:ferrous iron transport protein B
VLASYGPGDEFKRTSTLLEGMKTDHEIQYEKMPSDKMSKSDFDTQNSIYENEIKTLESKKLELSYAGRLGKFIEPAIRPLGFDWKIGISLITSLAAREVFVGTMATIYGAGDDDNTQPVRERMRAERDPETGKPVYTIATGISLMLFYAFAMQCVSTIAVVKRETKSWKWPAIQFAYMGVLAYLASLIAYQLMK